jgi:hypothetical protein
VIPITADRHDGYRHIIYSEWTVEVRIDYEVVDLRFEIQYLCRYFYDDVY